MNHRNSPFVSRFQSAQVTDICAAMSGAEVLHFTRIANARKWAMGILWVVALVIDCLFFQRLTWAGLLLVLLVGGLIARQFSLMINRRLSSYLASTRYAKLAGLTAKNLRW